MSEKPVSRSTGITILLGVLILLITLACLGISIYALAVGLKNRDLLRFVAPPPATPEGLPGVISPAWSCPAGEQRRYSAYSVRQRVNTEEYMEGVPCHVNNGDEGLYPDRRAQYSKTMLHDATTGLVAPGYYETLLTGVAAKNFNDVLRAPGASVKQTNPLAGLAFNLVGSDTQVHTMPPAPRFNSYEQAWEYVENAWMAMLRDVPFDQYATDPNANLAAAELNVTTGTLFRGNVAGSSVGPYLSQFFYLPCYYGTNPIDMRIVTPPTAGLNFMTNMTTWLNVQNGLPPLETATYGSVPRYMHNARDLCHFVHYSMLYQSYHQAVMMLLRMGAPYNPTNPYIGSANQQGFVTFGDAHACTLVAEVAERALRAAWYQKWFVSRRLRPEAFGARVDRMKKGLASFDIHPFALNSAAGSNLNATYGGYFIPQAYAEGSPTHPSYAAGHATVAGACVTVIKALFDGSYVIPFPVVPSADGTMLINYTAGLSLTVEYELNKLAANVGVGRNLAGVHWKSDFDASVRLGEQVAISMLRDIKTTFPEPLIGWRFRGIDGKDIVV